MLNTLMTQCFNEDSRALLHAETQITLWERWLLPIRPDAPVGDDPNYDDAFQALREEVNKLSGADISLVLTLCETLLTEQCKDVRVASYYIWARLHQDGEKGLAEGLSLLAGLVFQFGEKLLPSRPATRVSAIQWLSSPKVLGSLSLYPEVDKQDFSDAIASLYYLAKQFSNWQADNQPELNGLIAAMENRLVQAGGLDATVPQNAGSQSVKATVFNSGNNNTPPEVKTVQSGRDLLEQTKALARYLREQPQGWLASARLIRVVRWDTVHQLPQVDALGRTKLNSPRQELRQKLKRLYLNQHWLELLEQVELIFTEGVNHFWLDLQWYSAQALQKLSSPYDDWLVVLNRDVVSLLERLPTLDTFAFQDGTPFADDVTQTWLAKLIEPMTVDLPTQTVTDNDARDILALENEAIHLADTENVDSALRWISQIPGVYSAKSRFLQRLLMARIAEQYGKQEMAIHLLLQLIGENPNKTTAHFDLAEWEPDLLFEVYARLLKLLRSKHSRDTDKTLFQQRTEPLLAALIRIDPVRASVLCG
ncbi:type VI secretion system protein TssA [Thorsellia anophelis]|uniref:Type VI secretion system protein VasJ n=1 Tax=Thorsellia anophelis DSM 18579 TaxID=1123402 RepID=A0A1I0FTW5_9GAMM|nr:type VI secretion system protein TssA [Thorsellia anophelis]SET61649.1 type VI secretion system protein VasJ [Thorsellia anophelis DSM 18579]